MVAYGVNIIVYICEYTYGCYINSICYIYTYLCIINMPMTYLKYSEAWFNFRRDFPHVFRVVQTLWIQSCFQNCF